ncbi:MAG: hypothetical protein V4591_00955 [Bdellovibrionota bacterium]
MATNDNDDIFDPKDDYIFKKIFGHKEMYLLILSIVFLKIKMKELLNQLNS